MTAPTYFLSDVHLAIGYDDGEKRRRQRLFRLFDHVAESGGVLYILGDFFDFWFEYRHTSPQYYFDVLAQLQKLVDAGVTVHYILGNHDFWTRDFLTATIGIKVYKSALRVEIDGRQFLLTHGDGTLSGEKGYRLMRRVIRSRLFIFLFRWLHPDLGIAFAKSFSHNSRGNYKHSEAGAESMHNELLQFAQGEWDRGTDAIVMGHYHLNRLHTVAETGAGGPDRGRQLLCLGDWISHFTYGKIVAGRLTLETWPAE